MTNAATLPSPVAWWEDDAVMHRFVCDLVAHEMAAMRRTGGALPPPPWLPAMHIGRDLGADSLELLGLASALAEALHLHESGIEDYLLARPTLEDWAGIAQTGLSRYSSRMTFRTSGSTGAPKSCVHALAALWREAGETARLLPRRGRIYSAVPSHHIYGFLFSVLLPRALGVDGAAVIDLRGGSPARLARELRAGDLVVGHPEFWRAATRVVPAFPADVAGVTSTAPCPDDVSAALRDAGLAALLQVYGSSETAGVGWRFGHDQPYTLFSCWERCGDEAGLLRRQDGDGGTHACQDLLRWEDQRRFRPAGRIDCAVQVGGVNVFASRVRAELLRHPDVQDAAVRLMRPDEGNRLKAYVVPRDAAADEAHLHAALACWVESRLAAAERPRAFSFGAALPADEKGKPADWPLPAPALQALS